MVTTFILGVIFGIAVMVMGICCLAVSEKENDK